MYIRGQNSDHEYIVLMSKDELNDFIDFRLKQERRKGFVTAQENHELGFNS